MSAPVFTKRKFLQLDVKQQHKKCAQLLRRLYELVYKEQLKEGLGKPPFLKASVTSSSPSEEVLATYNTFLSWMKQLPYELLGLKELADRYHSHLSEAGLALKEHNLLPAIRTGDREPRRRFSDAAIYLDGVRSAYNVGSILRTTEAFRVGSVHFSSRTPFIDQEKVSRTAMGASEIVPCFQNTPLAELPRPFIALDTCDEAIALTDFLFPPVFTLILGNEEYGVSTELLREADYLIEIPLYGAKNSLNVACAFSIAAAEIARFQKN